MLKKKKYIYSTSLITFLMHRV